MRYIILLFAASLLFACQDKRQDNQVDSSTPEPAERPLLDLDEANRLAELPIACIEKEYPNKLNQTLSSDEDLLPPRNLHPSFYGCFDWHSSVHGHWSLVMLLKNFPGLDKPEEMKKFLSDRLTAENIAGEVEYFRKEQNKTFERTYGWAWLLKLAQELYTWDTDFARDLYAKLYPLAELISDMYIDFLPKLSYPIRVGTHNNTAFGLSFAWDYAIATGNDSLMLSIKKRAGDFYLYDTQCPMSWEPGGNDFLSPCLEEADIMRKILDQKEYGEWLKNFLPELADPSYTLEPGIVGDRADGQLAHLDGLNFSRAWCLYGIASSLPGYGHLAKIADEHIRYSLPNITDGHYEGGHWLASFALLALDSQ
ncbi:MAG TPA: DUF2891 domain-containing protein [Bacteroidetes bacterium]|nr:DUF2891 domain-containing protein [Bacteroidota bacterium]